MTDPMPFKTQPAVFRWRLTAVIGFLVLCAAFGTRAQKLAEVPDAAAQAEAKKLVDEVYAELINARTFDDKAATARVLIMRADETGNASAAKYVMYDTAHALAIEAGDTEAAMDAIDGLWGSFDDTAGTFIDKAASSLQALSRKARADAQHAAIAQAGIVVAERMIRNERLEDAMTLLSRLRSSAVRSKRPELNNAYKAMPEDLRAIRSEEQRIAADLKAIQQNPDDPALNLSVGTFLTLYRGDWEAGLPLLAHSSDQALADAAKADLAGASETKAQIAIGDLWWALASANAKIEQRSLTKRAKHWYRMALPTSTGIKRAVLAKRLAPPSQVQWGNLSLASGIKTMYQSDNDEAGAKPGPVAKQADWQITKKPGGTKQRMTLHFEGYLYSPKTTEVGLMVAARASSIKVEINGRLAMSGFGRGEAPVKLIKGYNFVRGSIVVPVVHIDNPDLIPGASITLSELDGNPIDIPAEHWFHDATR